MSIPTHVFNAACKYAIEGTPGTRNTNVSMLPQTGVDIRFDSERREFHEGFGPGSDMLQAQELLTEAYSISLGFDVYSGAFIRDCCHRTAGVLPSLSFEFCMAADAAEAVYGARCNTLRLSAAERGCLHADTDWVAQHHSDTGVFTWTAPQYYPYVWAGGTWSLGGQIIGIDLTCENNVFSHYAMSSTLGGTPYDPSHILPGFMNVSARIRAITEYDISPTTDDVTASLIFVSGTNTLTLGLTGGAYWGQEPTIPRDGAVEFGVDMRFRNITISEG